MALMHISVIPLATTTTSLSPCIAELHRELERQGATFRLTDMGTEVEGSAEELLRLAHRLHEIPFAHHARRVVTCIQIDDRRDKETHLGDKVASVQRRLAGTSDRKAPAASDANPPPAGAEDTPATTETGTASQPTP